MRLSDLIAQLHKELEAAQQPAEDGSFVLDACEVSLSVDLKKAGTGGLEFKVIGAGGAKVGGELARTDGHRLTFKFVPLPKGFEEDVLKEFGRIKGQLEHHGLSPGDISSIGKIYRGSGTYMTGVKKWLR